MSLPADTSEKAQASRELVARVTSAAALALIALVGVAMGGWPATVIVAVFAVAIFYEWTSITGNGERWVLVFALAVMAACAAVTLGNPEIALLVLATGAVLATPAGGLPWRASGVFYAGLFGVALLTLRLSPSFGIDALLFVFAVVWATDTGAYFVGRRVGGAKLWPAVSPNKTRSGAIGGAAVGICAGLLVLLFTGFPVMIAHVVLALLLSLVAQAGDLFESALKRRFDRKDASQLIPGHGGVMDRVDGLVFAGALAAAIGTARDPFSPAAGLLQW